MKKTLTLLTFFIPLVFNLQAQYGIPVVPPPSPTVYNTIAISNIKLVNGTPYSENDYRNGELWTIEKQHFAKNLLYRFNETNNMVEVKDAEGNQAFVKAEVIDSFHIHTANKTVVRYYKGAFLNSLPLKNSLVQLVYTGKNVVIYKVPRKFEREKAFNGYIGDVTSKYEIVRQDEYYIKIGSKSLERLTLSKKDLLKKIPSKRAALTEEFEYIDFYESITEQILIELLDKIKA